MVGPETDLTVGVKLDPETDSIVMVLEADSPVKVAPEMVSIVMMVSQNTDSIVGRMLDPEIRSL